MLRVLVLISSVTLAACSASRALPGNELTEAPPMAQSGSPTEQERIACQADVDAYCRAALPQAMRVAACLQKHRKKISPACQQVLVNHGL